MTRIKAAVCHEFGKPLHVEDIDLRAPENDEIEVTLGAVAICHSDISFANGDWGGFLPAVYGHEAAGRVSAVGDNVRGLEYWRSCCCDVDPCLWALFKLFRGRTNHLRNPCGWR